MKTSLKEALSLFSVAEKISLLFILVSRKFGSGYNYKKDLFTELVNYAGLIEQGFRMRKYSSDKLVITARINNNDLEFLIRRSSSDLKVFRTIIIEEEYKSALSSLPQNGKEKINIIDAGANIGMTSIFFAAHRDNVNIVAIEPDSSNFSMLEQNIKLNKLNNIIPTRCALWTKSSDLKVVDSFRDGENWSLSVEEISKPEADSIKGVPLKEIMGLGSMSSVDLLKIDIEGGERYLFHSDDFLHVLNHSVKSLVIEIHDEYNIREKIYSEMNTGNFLLENDTHVTFFRKKK